MTVEDVMIRGVETAGADTRVEVLALTMAEEGIGSVVIEREGDPVGIVTDRDLVIQVIAEGADPAELTAHDVMTPYPEEVREDAGVFDLTNAMAAREVRRMPVVDDDGDIAGIVTLDDLIVLLATELANLAGVIEAESPPYSS